MHGKFGLRFSSIYTVQLPAVITTRRHRLVRNNCNGEGLLCGADMGFYSRSGAFISALCVFCKGRTGEWAGGWLARVPWGWGKVQQPGNAR